MRIFFIKLTFLAVSPFLLVAASACFWKSY